MVEYIDIFDMASGRRILKYTTQAHTRTSWNWRFFNFIFRHLVDFTFIHSMASCRQYISSSLLILLFFISVAACARFPNANEKSFRNELEKRNTQTAAAAALIFRDTTQNRDGWQQKYYIQFM